MYAQRIRTGGRRFKQPVEPAVCSLFAHIGKNKSNSL